MTSIGNLIINGILLDFIVSLVFALQGMHQDPSWRYSI